MQSYEKQSFHSGTPPPFNMANTQTAGGTSAQPYGMYLPMPAAGHHNMIHPPIHQVEYNSEQQFLLNQEQNIQVAYENEQMWHQNQHNNHDYAMSGHNQQDNSNYIQDDLSGISFFAE